MARAEILIYLLRKHHERTNKNDRTVNSNDSLKIQPVAQEHPQKKIRILRTIDQKQYQEK